MPNQIYWTKFIKPKLENWIYKIKSTKENFLIVKNQIYRIRSIQSKLQKLVNPTNTMEKKPNSEKI